MTLYFRPVHLDSQLHIKEQGQPERSSMASYILKVQAVQEDGEWTRATYQLSESHNDRQHKYTATAAKHSIRLILIDQAGKEVGEGLIDSKKIVSGFKGKKKDQFSEEISLGNHILSYKYRYNKFIEICGGSNVKQWALEYSLSNATASTFKDEQGDKTKARMEETNTDPYQSTQTQPFREVESKIEEKQQGTGEKEKESKEEASIRPIKPKVQFYKGPCQTTNLFSFMDPSPKNGNQKFNIIEGKY